MTPGTVFISHRAEYGKLVRELEKAIEKNSRGKIDVFISEEVAMNNLFGIAKASVKWDDVGRWQSARSARTGNERLSLPASSV
jgi:hypothetical protein